MSNRDPFNLLRTKQESVGSPPGTIAYSGNYSDVDIKVELIRYNKDDYSYDTIKDFDDINDVVSKENRKNEVCWINVIGLHDYDLIRIFGNSLNIHSMDLEDIVHVSQWSKIVNQSDYLFSVLKMIYLKEESIIHEQVSVIMKDNIIITFQETPGDVFDYIRDRLKNPTAYIKSQDTNYLYYSILDSLIDEYMIVINHISLKFNEIEMQIIEELNPDKEELYMLRKELLYFSNSISPLIDAIRKFLSAESEFYNKSMTPYYQDITDHLNQISDSIMAYREMSNSLHEVQMSNMSMRMDKTMMTLTIFSAIFIPLSFLTGVFGMNFKYLPGLDNPMSFTYFAIFCLSLATGMITFFKFRNWF